MVIIGTQFDHVEMEVHGGLSRSFEKLSYRLRFDDPESTQLDFFGDGPGTTRQVVLQASWIDRSFSRAKIAMDLTRAEGGLAPRISHVQLYLNGKWHGLYLLIERVDNVFLDRNGLPVEDALLYKAENHSASWELRDDPLEGFAVKGDGNNGGERLTAFFGNLLATELEDEAYDAETSAS